MADSVIMSYNSVTHITADDPNADSVKTKCGRTLTRFFSGHFGQDDCTKCGAAGDYLVIKQRMEDEERAQYLAQKQKAEELKLRNEQRAQERKEIAAEIIAQLQETGITGLPIGQIELIEKTAYYHCDNYRFKINGYTFELKAVL